MPEFSLAARPERLPRFLFTFDETLSLVPVSRRTLQRFVSDELIDVVRLGRRVFFRPDDIEAFLLRQRNAVGESK